MARDRAFHHSPDLRAGGSKGVSGQDFPSPLGPSALAWSTPCIPTIRGRDLYNSPHCASDGPKSRFVPALTAYRPRSAAPLLLPGLAALAFLAGGALCPWQALGVQLWPRASGSGLRSLTKHNHCHFGAPPPPILDTTLADGENWRRSKAANSEIQRFLRAKSPPQGLAHRSACSWVTGD